MSPGRSSVSRSSLLSPARDLAHFALGERAERKHRARDLLLRKPPEEVALVLPLVCGAGDCETAIALDDSRVVARCKLVEADFPLGKLWQHPELHVAVADDAGIRSPPRRAFAAEVVEDDFLVFLRAVEDAVVDAELCGKRFRRRDVLGLSRAEACVALAAHVAAFAPELHRDAGDVVSLAL